MLKHKLYRLEKGKKIAGVCCGVADMLQWDPTVVRLIAVFLAVSTGIWPGIATYLAGWWLMPVYEESPRESEAGQKDK